MKVFITGAGGQLGCDLVRALSPFHELIPMTRRELDITDESAVREAIRQARPDAVVHAAAYTDVDGAERNPDAAYSVNGAGTWNVAVASQSVQAKLVYVSTDYVFDGTKGSPYDESDRTNPINVYGGSKLLGEKFAQTLCPKHFIVRTSWLYGRSGANFVTKVAAKALRDRALTLVDDQFGSPTYTMDLAVWIGHLLATERYGTYHASNAGCCSRYEFGQEIVRALGLDGISVMPVSAQAYPLPAARPAYSAFDDAAARKNGMMRMRDWRTALHAFIRDDYDKGESP